MSQTDNRKLIEGLLRIRDKRGNLVRFRMNVSQEFYWKRRTRRNIILKPRQKGLSKIIDGDQLIDCIRKNTKAVVISHEKEATYRLFEAVRDYVDNLDVKPLMSIDSKQEMKFPKRGSSYFVGTAGQKAFGRGDTIDRAHLSEAAFYDDLDKILSGVAEAAEYGQIDIESTANGRNAFYDLWQKAKAGKSPYTPIFIPWFIDREYSSDSLTEKERNGLSAAVQEMFAIPDDEIIASLDPEEKLLAARAASEYGIIMTAGQFKWRRYKIWDKGRLFFQEYPEDDVSCFLQSGRSVFTKITCDPSKRIPLDDIESWGTHETRAALKRRMLYAGVDGAEGTPTGDRHVFSVIDAPGYDPKAVVIYEYASNEPIDVFWDKVEKIAKAFNLFTAVEKNGLGVAHVREAQKRGVAHMPWTTGTNRPVMISDLEEDWRKENLIETYPEAVNEAYDMIYATSTRAEHQPNKHDDRIFARAIAWQLLKGPRPGVTVL